MKSGELVVLRLGTKKVFGVGEIVGDYEWHDEFGDIDGWDLQHVRRVKWLWKYSKTPKKFPTYSLKLGDTTQILDSKLVTDWMESLLIPSEMVKRDLVTLPPDVENPWISLDDISEYLFNMGVASYSIEKLRSEIDELIRIAKWYRKFGNPSEFETVAYLIIPLLRSLGWTPQKMAVEWNKVDIALFSHLPRKDNNLSVVVEAKKKDSSCLTAKSQAETYAKGRSNCKRLIVSDGLRYGIYFKEGTDFRLNAYMNLTRLRKEYPIYNCKGAKDVLLTVTPDWRHG